MRDILELRQTKVELGVFPSGDIDNPTNFENMTLETRLVGSSPHSYNVESNFAPNLQSSIPWKGTSRTQVLSSVAASSASTVQMCRAQPLHPAADSVMYSSLVLRDDSPDSILRSEFSSPTLSVSCSPSASDSDFGMFEEDEEDGIGSEHKVAGKETEEKVHSHPEDCSVQYVDETETAIYSKDADYYQTSIPILPPSAAQPHSHNVFQHHTQQRRDSGTTFAVTEYRDIKCLPEFSEALVLNVLRAVET